MEVCLHNMSMQMCFQTYRKSECVAAISNRAVCLDDNLFCCLVTWSGMRYGSECKQEGRTLAYRVQQWMWWTKITEYTLSVRSWPWKHTHLSDESSARQWEPTVRRWERPHHCLHIDWHYVVGPDENNRQPLTCDLTLRRKRAVIGNPVGGCGGTINEETLTKQILFSVPGPEIVH